jgi:hypothetical protein
MNSTFSRVSFVLAIAPVCFAIPPKGHVAEMSYLDNGVVRLGVDVRLGGAVTHLSKSTEAAKAGAAAGEPPVNVVNSWDWGRQVQMSYYGGPVPFTPGGKQPAAQWRELGWNPVQAGDHFGNASKVLEHRNDGKTIYVKCVPMQWPLDDEPAECTFETWYALEGKTVRVRARLNNARGDKTQYAARMQELPAVYTNGPFHRLMTYRGERPFTGGELSRIDHPMGKDGSAWAHWLASENWAALVDDDGWGLGVWNPGCYAFCGGFSGMPGKGGPADALTGYLAPLRQEILDHDGRHEYEYQLILGTLKEIRGHVYASAKRPGPPAWVFEKDRQGWRYGNATDAGWPIRGELDVRLEGEDPQLISPVAFWRAEDAPVLYVRAAVKGEHKTGQVFFSLYDAAGKARYAKPVDFQVVPDGAWRTYEVRLADSPEYKGVITGLRIDPAPAGRAGEWVKVKSVGFGR